MKNLSKKKILEQIAELNSTVFCRIAPSKIQGVGVFAIRDIPKGQKLGCCPNFKLNLYSIPYSRFNEILPKIRELIISYWGSVVNDADFLSPNDNAILTSFMNHSDFPNYDYETDYALRDIKKGEEITENYKIMQKNYRVAFPF